MQLFPQIICQRIAGALLGLLVCCVISLLAGCRSVVYVPVETVRSDSVYIDRLTRDSVCVRDSVWVSLRERGDTVFITKAAMCYAYRDRLRTDTVAVVREHREKVPVEVERQLTWWERTRLKAFWWLAAAVAALCLVVAWLARRLCRNGRG